jgi:hypothetical protein
VPDVHLQDIEPALSSFVDPLFNVSLGIVDATLLNTSTAELIEAMHHDRSELSDKHVMDDLLVCVVRFDDPARFST